MKPVRTSKALEAFQVIFPGMSADMVRRAVELGELKAVRNFASKRGNYFYPLSAIKSFLMDKKVNQSDIDKVIKHLEEG